MRINIWECITANITNSNMTTIHSLLASDREWGFGRCGLILQRLNTEFGDYVTLDAELSNTLLHQKESY